jgi:hypothetical protein
MTDPSTFDRRFLAYFAIAITIIGMAFVFAVVFVVVPKENQQNASMALGFVLGTLLAAPIGFFYGASKAQPPAPPTTAPLTTALTISKAPTGTPSDPVAVHETPTPTAP